MAAALATWSICCKEKCAHLAKETKIVQPNKQIMLNFNPILSHNMVNDRSAIGLYAVHKYTFFIAALNLLLVGCGPGVDLPDNIPQLGRWTDTLRVVSVRSNGVAYDKNLLPKTLLPIEKSETFCGEPFIRSADDIRGLFDETLLKNCTFSEMKRFGPRASLSAQCSMPNLDAMPVRASLKFDGEEKPNHLDGNIAADFYLQSPKGTTDKVTIEAKREMIRIGDC